MFSVEYSFNVFYIKKKKSHFEHLEKIMFLQQKVLKTNLC